MKTEKLFICCTQSRSWLSQAVAGQFDVLFWTRFRFNRFTFAHLVEWCSIPFAHTAYRFLIQRYVEHTNAPLKPIFMCVYFTPERDSLKRQLQNYYALTCSERCKSIAHLTGSCSLAQCVHCIGIYQHSNSTELRSLIQFRVPHVVVNQTNE